MSDYEADFVTWSERQAGLLRGRGAGVLVNEAEIDWSNIAEEIDQLGKSQGRELDRRVAAVMLHLLKLQGLLATDPRPGWRETVREQRDEIERLLEDAPSLRGRVSASIAAQMVQCRRRAQAALADYDEQPKIDLDTIAYAENDVLGSWLP